MTEHPRMVRTVVWWEREGIWSSGKSDEEQFLSSEGRSGKRMASICKDIGYSAEADSAQSESGLWHLRGAEGDRLSERSEGRKLPQLEPRALATPTGNENFSQRGASGGMQGGPRRGRSPITGPTLPRAAQASQTTPDGGTSCPKGSKNQRNIPSRGGETARRTQNQQKGSKPLGLPPALFRKKLQPKSTTSPLQPPAKPVPRHTQGKATRPRQRPCQKAAYPRAARSRRQHPRAWKAPANPPD